MKFHSDLFGWEYVWRNFADDKGGTVITETAAEDSAFVSMTVATAVGTTGKTAKLLIAPASHHGKKSSGIKVVAPFEALDDFVFNIFPETFAQQLVKAVGAQDIKIQDQLFDSKFMIQGNQPERVAALFADVNLRELVLLQPPARLGIETKTAKSEDKNALPAKYHAVVYQFDGHVDKLHQLETALSVVKAVLEHMFVPFQAETSTAYGDGRLDAEGLSEEDGALSQSRRLRSPLLDR
jgi:hypothetical protein